MRHANGQIPAQSFMPSRYARNLIVDGRFIPDRIQRLPIRDQLECSARSRPRRVGTTTPDLNEECGNIGSIGSLINLNMPSTLPSHFHVASCPESKHRKVPRLALSPSPPSPPPRRQPAPLPRRHQQHRHPKGNRQRKR